MTASTLERAFAHWWGLLAPDLPAPVAEYPVGPGRKFRWDFAFVEARVAVEIEGGIYGGAHGRPAGIHRDIEKNNFGVLNGWKLLRFSGKDLDTDPAGVVAQVRALLTQQEVNS